ncbi:zincin-like metallopeptidase toxin domain-containing protein [Rhizobium esperanzae]
MARANGSGQLLLPENPTVLQVKHELSHYLDFKKMGFEAYRDMGRLGREASVLERLQANRSWSAYTDAERRFSIDYVNRLRGQ